MYLIDGDAMKERVGDLYRDNQVELPYLAAVCEAVRMEAEVPAIPRDWIRDRMLFGDPYTSKCCWKVLKEWDEEKRAAWREQGLCKDCGGPLEDERFRTCRLCRKIHRVLMRERRDRMMSEGRCVRCGKVKENPKLLNCAKCSLLRDEQWRKRAGARKAAGLCVRCGKPAADKPKGGKYVECAECREKYAMARGGI